MSHRPIGTDRRGRTDYTALLRELQGKKTDGSGLKTADLPPPPPEPPPETPAAYPAARPGAGPGLPAPAG